MTKLEVTQEDRDALIEEVARAMMAVSRPDATPDDLTPGARGSIGLMAKWRQFEHLATAAVRVMEAKLAERDELFDALAGVLNADPGDYVAAKAHARDVWNRIDQSAARQALGE